MNGPARRGDRAARAGRSLVRHRERIHRGADIGAKTAGLAWLYVLAIYFVIMLLAWIAVIVFRRTWLLVLAIAITVAIVPPMRRELRRRDEIRRALGRD